MSIPLARCLHHLSFFLWNRCSPYIPSFPNIPLPVPHSYAILNTDFIEEKYRSGHNGAHSKWSTRLFVLSTRKSSRDAGLSQFKKVNILLFCPVVLSSVFFQNFRLNIWRVVRVVEGAALEILRVSVRFVHQKPCSHAGFTRFEKLNNLLFFPSVLSKAFFYRKKVGKNGG